MIDLHLHSNYSPDSKQPMEEYFINKEFNKIVFTDHLDFEDKFVNYDVIPDYKSLKLELESLKKTYKKDYLLGVEIGYHPTVKNKLKEHLVDKNFDIKILSIHQDGIYDYLTTPEGYTVDLEAYLNAILEGLNEISGVTILGHLDYAFRKNKLNEDFFKSPKLVEIFKLLKQKNIALEVNTRSMYEYDKMSFYQKLLPLYLECNCNLISLGSDAHKIEQHQFYFDEAQIFLKEIGDFVIINKYLGE